MEEQYAVWNTVNKEMEFFPKSKIFMLNKEVYIVRKPYGVDILGKTIFEGDHVLFLNHDYLLYIDYSCYEIKNGRPINYNHSRKITDEELWSDCIVVGNIYEGYNFCKKKITMFRKSFNHAELNNVRKKLILHNENMSDEEKLKNGICPTCGNQIIFSDGCKSCSWCGFSACGI